jgi:aminomethyltransferase
MNEAVAQKTPLHALHVELGARMAPFAGYDMPIQYPAGILAEHLHTRKSAGLFDVSHMGQALIEGADHAAVAAFLEALCPADFLNLAPGRQRYSQLLNDDGGIVDDLMVTRPPGADGALRLVVNASRKAVDYAVIRSRLPSEIRLTPLPEAALIALQGPMASSIMARLAPGDGLEAMAFMSARPARIAGIETFVSRSGYTGEDGYEISLASSQAESFARILLADPNVAPIGLGARDSLRLEAGLCLYGHELDETVDPIEAALSWSIQKRRRIEGGFPGASRIHSALADRPARQRVGIRPDGRAPAREGAEIVSPDGAPIGVVTSGGFGPSVGAPIAMGYVARAYAAVGTPIGLVVRGKPLSARVAAVPFYPHAYYRGQTRNG